MSKPKLTWGICLLAASMIAGGGCRHAQRNAYPACAVPTTVPATAPATVPTVPTTTFSPPIYQDSMPPTVVPYQGAPYQGAPYQGAPVYNGVPLQGGP